MKTVSTTDETATGFPVLFTKDEFEGEILDLMLLFTQQTHFIFMADSALQSNSIWQLLSPTLADHSAICTRGDYACDIGLTYSDIKGLSMAQTLMELYKYGVQGIQDGIEIDCCDGYENQVSRLCYDINRSEFLKEWDDCGARAIGKQTTAAERCLYVCELANARLILEGAQEGFFLDDREIGFLSIRQMSLLSGMTEATIRTLASRNRKNIQTSSSDSNSQLITRNDGKNTSIAIEDAKAWLKSKGRYTPITHESNRGAEDFTQRKFMSRGEIETAIEKRLTYLEATYGESVIAARIINAGVVPKYEQIVPDIDWTKQVIGEEQLLNRDLMRRLAVVLELPTELFALRATEAVMQDKLRAIEQQVKNAQKTK